MSNKHQMIFWKECAEAAHAFLNSLPHGWLAHTTGDIGALNEFYIKYREASHLNKSATTTAETSNQQGKIERDYEPEQSYGTAHDFKEHVRFGGTKENY